MKLKTKLSKLRHDGHITDAEYSIIINVLNKFSTQQKVEQPCEDAISREEAIRVAEQGQIQGYEWQFKKLCTMLPVIPKTKPCEDCVSRDAVIRLVEQYPNIIGEKCSGLISDIKHLPSVQPKAEPCDDVISRAEVLKYAQIVRDDEGIVHEMVHVDDIKNATPMTWSGWTPATQPPEPNTAVLLYVRYKSTGRWTYLLGMWNASKQAWEDWRTPYQLEEEFEVIAWMELPEGYEEGKHE